MRARSPLCWQSPSHYTAKPISSSQEQEVSLSRSGCKLSLKTRAWCVVHIRDRKFGNNILNFSMKTTKDRSNLLSTERHIFFPQKVLFYCLIICSPSWRQLKEDWFLINCKYLPFFLKHCSQITMQHLGSDSQNCALLCWSMVKSTEIRRCSNTILIKTC